MDQFFSINFPPSMTAPPPENGKQINNGRVWYTALMPLLAMYVQSYATCFELGVLAWTVSAAMWVISLIADRRYLDREGYDVSGISPFLALIPPVYMIKRQKLLGQQPSTAPIVFVMVFVFALYANGFTRYALMKDSVYTEFVRTQSWTDVSSVKSALGETTVSKDIGSSLKSYAKTEPDKGKMNWTVSKNGRKIIVTASCSEKEFEAVFAFEYDGFDAKETVLEQVTVKGKVYDGKEAAEMLAEILKSLPADESSSDSK